jgi:acetyl-CoA acetyltransferase
MSSRKHHLSVLNKDLVYLRIFGQSPAVNLAFSLKLQSDPQKLKKLGPVFKEDGTITAGNSSTFSDGAAVLLLKIAAFADEHEFKVLGRI